MLLENLRRQARLLCGAAMATLVVAGPALSAEAAVFNIPSQPLSTALAQFGVQSEQGVFADSELTSTKVTRGVVGEKDPEAALTQLLAGTGLAFRREAGAFVIVQAGEGGSGPQQSGAGEGGAGVIEALVVTAQKREEAIQDVPIAISAFSQQALEAQKIEGGFDLLKAIPNVTFSKNNFSGYNFSIRGIGTKGISVATDPGVAVEFNGTPLIRNRLFEQEYFDVERVEVLRGPQGTLHGRNATAGVINVISSKPDLDTYSAMVKGEVGNYKTRRLSGYANMPLVEGKLGIRVAGALTSRDGYDFNATTGNSINGRELWSTRVTVGFEPTERIRADLLWERFEEDDNRSRTGKQLCHRDPGPSSLGAQANLGPVTAAWMSQGCKAGNLYEAGAFGTPNGLSIPFILAMAGLREYGAPPIGYSRPVAGNPDRNLYGVDPIPLVDPYGGMMQTRDLRTISSIKDPIYRATTDVFELNMDFELSDTLTLSSQTAYLTDKIYSFQDYNRFNTVPIFADSSNLWEVGTDPDTFAEIDIPSPLRGLTPNGIYCDPQLGCSDTIAGFDISQAESKQFSQEFRLQSNFDGPLNFSVGANYLRYETLEDYYVMFNLVTLLLQSNGLLNAFNQSSDYTMCMPKTSLGMPTGAPAVPLNSPDSQYCTYIDPNPVDRINGEGHNYFRSKNPYELTSTAGFGEVYWEATPTVKVTAGVRYTNDEKVFTPVPTQLLLSSSLLLSGTVDRGYPSLPDIKQTWREWTGRVGVDWKPDLPFTDQTLLYAFASRGYKGGGANPPGIGYSNGGEFPPLLDTLAYPPLFEPEYVTALELGSKNTLLDGALVINAAAFYYDYKDYQVSQIKERTSVNENFDATVWGLELESVFAPTRNLRMNLTVGYQDSRIGDGEQSIDLMDRTQGHDEYVVFKPWVQLPSNCVIPSSVIEALIAENRNFALAAPGWPEYAVFPVQCGGFFGGPLNPSGAPNDGQGFYADLSGNELPNAPHWTVSFGAEYSVDLNESWRATVRGDAYWQSQSWHRVYNNDPYDKLHGWYNTNLSIWLENGDAGLKVELYAKNLLDKTPITDAFLNSDDTGLTTNVFVLDPRLIGLSIRKEF